MLHLDLSLSNFERKFYAAKEILMQKMLFLHFYEQQDKFQYIIKKCAQGKNQVMHDLSACVIKKFNGYNW